MVKWVPPIGQIQTEARGQISPWMWSMETSLPGPRMVQRSGENGSGRTANTQHRSFLVRHRAPIFHDHFGTKLGLATARKKKSVYTKDLQKIHQDTVSHHALSLAQTVTCACCSQKQLRLRIISLNSPWFSLTELLQVGCDWVWSQ